MISSPATDAKVRTPNFDKFSFVKYVKNIGRAYRKQAMELVSLCRTFSQTQQQTLDSNARLRSALKIVDEALSSAADVTKKTSEKVDEAFKKAIEELERYEMKYHHRKRMVDKRMATAKKKDNKFLKIWEFFKEMFSPKAADNRQPEPTSVVEFLLLKSLPDPSPVIVKQVLSDKSNLPEVLWNFSCFKGEQRLTLKQNPHFYKFPDIPIAPKQYDGEFRVDPIEDFQHAKIWVIIDKPGRIFLETPPRSRAFGNVWHVPDNDAIVFKDVCGKLEGENIVHASIIGPSDLWYLEEFPSSPTSPSPVVSPSLSSPSNTTASSTTSSASDDSFRDWREPIRRRLSERVITPETNICIMAVGSSSPPSSLTSPAGSCANDSSGNSITDQSSYVCTQRTPNASILSRGVSQRWPSQEDILGRKASSYRENLHVSIGGDGSFM